MSDEQHDDDLPRFSIRLGLLLALMRVAAGYRGHSRVVWTAGGFRYVLSVTRLSAPVVPSPPRIDSDPEAVDGAEAVRRIVDALTS